MCKWKRMYMGRSSLDGGKKLSGGDSYTHGAVAQLGEHLTCRL